MTRRDLARLSAAGALLARRKSRAAAPAKYTSALDGFETKVDPATFDPIAYTLKLHDEAPVRLTFRATTRKQAEAWQKQLRPRVVELMGGFPAKPAPLQQQTIEVKEYPGYRREKFVFESPRRRRARVPANAGGRQGAARRRSLHPRTRSRRQRHRRHERVKKMYEAFGVAENTGHEVFDGQHGFSGNLGLPFLAKHLA